MADNSMPDISGLVDILKNDPELLNRAHGILNSLGTQSSAEEEQNGEGQPNDSTPESMPNVDMNKVMSLLSGIGMDRNENGEKAEGHGHGRRTALLKALKPYLSPERQAAIDHMLTFSKIEGLFSDISQH